MADVVSERVVKSQQRGIDWASGGIYGGGFGCYSLDRREMTGMTPLVRAKGDSSADFWTALPFFPTSSLHMRRPELKRVVPCLQQCETRAAA